MDLREAAAELYAGDPAGFVARRSAAASEAGPELAGQIRSLRKPSAAAAAVNALVRTESELVDAILDVGDRMRDAVSQRDRDTIRTLTAERQRLVQRAVRDRSLSPAVQREVEETLQAAAIDPAAAAAVRSGVLVRALVSSGVDAVELGTAVALPVVVPDRDERDAPLRPAADRSGRSAPRERSSTSAAERREAERRRHAAESAVASARTAAAELDGRLDAEAHRRSELETEREAVARHLDRTMAELAESRATERDLRTRANEAHRVLRNAERELQDLREREAEETVTRGGARRSHPRA